MCKIGGVALRAETWTLGWTLNYQIGDKVVHSTFSHGHRLLVLSLHFAGNNLIAVQHFYIFVLVLGLLSVCSRPCPSDKIRGMWSSCGICYRVALSWWFISYDGEDVLHKTIIPIMLRILSKSELRIGSRPSVWRRVILQSSSAVY